MIFHRALEALMKGLRIRRSCWEEHNYLYRTGIQCIKKHVSGKEIDSRITRLYSLAKN